MYPFLFFFIVSLLTISGQLVDCYQNYNPSPGKQDDITGEFIPPNDPNGPRSVQPTGYYGQYCNIVSSDPPTPPCGGAPLCKTIKECLEYTEDWGLVQGEDYRVCVSIAFIRLRLNVLLIQDYSSLNILINDDGTEEDVGICKSISHSCDPNVDSSIQCREGETCVAHGRMGACEEPKKTKKPRQTRW